MSDHLIVALKILKKFGASSPVDRFIQSANRRAWSGRDEDIIEIYRQSWNAPSREQFIRMVCSQVEKPTGGDFAFFEFGCNMGINLEILHAIYGDDGFQYYGCDINQHCIDHMNRNSWAHGFVASDETIKKHLDEIPGHIDVFISKSTLGYLNDKGLDNLFHVFAGRVGSFVVGDSTENIDGDHPVLKDYYFLHPFRKVLARHSFIITRYEDVKTGGGLTNTGMFTARKRTDVPGLQIKRVELKNWYLLLVMLSIVSLIVCALWHIWIIWIALLLFVGVLLLIFSDRI